MKRCSCGSIKSSTSPVAKCARGIVLFASIFGLVFYVNECYKKLRITPEVLVNEKIVNSWTVPFPAITICPPLLVKSETLNLTKCRQKLERGESLKRKDLEKLVSLLHVCPEVFFLSSLSNKYEDVDNNHGEIINQISTKIEDILNVCAIESFLGCENIFIRSLTDSGYCFSFNMLGYQSIFNDGIVKDFDGYKRTKIVKSIDPTVIPEYYNDVNSPEPSSWTLEQGYSVDNHSAYPLPAIKGRISITQLKIRDIDASNFCLAKSNLYFVYLHLPNELPTLMHLNYFYKFHTNNVLQISAELKQNDETLKNFNIEERGCYFEGERNLKFFKSYTKLNCENECLIDFTRRQCGCVRLSMPRTSDMNVCKLKNIECCQIIAQSWPSIYLRSTERHDKFPDFPCGCLPSCTQIKYTVVDKFSVETVKKNDGYQYSTLYIKFDESQIVKRTNYVTYKLLNFVSDVGGLIGLFLGFSILSMFETFLYIYVSLKALLTRLISKTKEQKENTEIEDEDNEVQILNSNIWIDDEPNIIDGKEPIFIIPDRPSTPLEIENLEN